ncbi:unnamed protein product [Blepharisma stoltei]|uniref:very-long-chain (3R)-3-hydroxyacyl-CoA dehydratase n=1 Tax=Blepharisma stoltei TaxID=1481888 RepID=A0AAU9K3U4_9CILI|nr:unnamed protein product [Blepharisma stoltei]
MGLYLAAYNGIQFLGWFLILCFAVVTSLGGLQVYMDPNLRILVLVFQNLMAIEILHSALRISSSPLFPTFIQVFSRLGVVWGALELEPTTKWTASLLIAWGCAESIRYSNYFYASLDLKQPKFMVWLRYSGFIVLYPIGVFSELMCLYSALPVIEKCCPRVYSISMPNPYNFSFDFLIFVKYFVPLFYAAGFPFLYGYMLTQRKRKLKTE